MALIFPCCSEDAQLEAAPRHLQDEIAKDPRDVPEAPVYPNKAFSYAQ